MSEPEPSSIEFCPSQDDLFYAFMKLLPKGVIWSTVDFNPTRDTTIKQFWYAIAGWWKEFEDYLCSALDQWFCEYATFTLDKWNQDYGIPDECELFTGNLCSKVSSGGPPTAAYLMSLLEANGYIGEGRWLTGNDSEFPGVRSTFYVVIDEASSPAFMGSDTSLPFPLGEGITLGDADLTKVQCMLERYIPLHTVAIVEALT